MKEEQIKNADSCYHLAEEKAFEYFQSLYMQLEQKTYIPLITKDIQSWKQSHIRHYSVLSFFPSRKEKTDPKSYHNHIQWLNYTGKLDKYLDRSISYIFMRDLGKALDSPDTQNRVRTVVNNLKKHLIQSTSSDRRNTSDSINFDGLYRWAQKEGIESTLIWLLNKLKTVSLNIPKGMDPEHAQRKLIKIIAGVYMQVVNEMDQKIHPKERMKKLDEAIRLGYSYGLTYPFIDDLLDADILSADEKKQYSNLIRTTLITGSVPELGEWLGHNKDLIHYIHSELKDAFDFIKSHQRPETLKAFLEQSYVFFQSQEVDRVKVLTDSSYTNEELFIPIILKSSSSRLIVRSIIAAPDDNGFDNPTFYYGIYNQLADDFADMFDDMKDGAVTPYTYFLKYHDKRSDLINPFELYWTVITHLIHNVYHSDIRTCEVILDRAINGLKRFKERHGPKKYDQVMELFASVDSKFNGVIQNMVQKADDVDFFDKLLRDHMISILKNEKEEQQYFLDTIAMGKNQINNILEIAKNDHHPMMEDSIRDAANFSLEGDGKRLRPLITWVMGINEYGLSNSAIVPLLKSLEYMHTASLIFDDLPSQDNSSTRRGKPTLHQIYNVAIAELTGLYLTQKAIEEQTLLDQFDPKTVLNLIRYSTQLTEIMCKGQVMDLNAKEKPMTLEQLNLMCFYKTGLGFEASLIMPAILAHAKVSEIEALKQLAYHAGIAFQIKDDLLDIEGDQSTLGKPIGKDAENNKSTFVSILGIDGARKEMWEHYCLAMEALQKVPRKTTFLKQLLKYIIHRDH